MKVSRAERIRRRNAGLCIECGAPVDKPKVGGYKYLTCKECRQKHGSGKPETLCWACRHAVPKISGDVYVQGCEWSIKRLPVLGWDADARILKVSHEQDCFSYTVKSCPKFEKGR